MACFAGSGIIASDMVRRESKRIDGPMAPCPHGTGTRLWRLLRPLCRT